MSFLILVRHGQSIWNLEKRFTGWVDVDLTDKGKLEAEKAGSLIKSTNINLDLYNYLNNPRSFKSLKVVKNINVNNKNIPIRKKPS